MAKSSKSLISDESKPTDAPRVESRENAVPARKSGNSQSVRKLPLNQLFRNQLATCDRPGLKGRVLTLACEVVMGKRARVWRCEYTVVDVDWTGKRRVARMFAYVSEWELVPMAEMEVAA